MVVRHQTRASSGIRNGSGCKQTLLLHSINMHTPDSSTEITPNAASYRRTPLPKSAQMPTGWLALCLMSLIFSPFVGFALDGKVSHTGLVTGLWFALVPLSAITFIWLTRWHAWRRLPSQLVEEWTAGRLIPAVEAPSVMQPVLYSDENNWLEMQTDGVTVARQCLLSMQGVPHAQQLLWVADLCGDLFVPWHDISEWIVETDSDGPDYYLLKLQPKGTLRVRRFLPDAATESTLLDAVRSVGKRPVRLRCDIDH